MVDGRPRFDANTLYEAEQYRRRKTTSVLAIVFTDIANSTYLREQLGEIEYEELREKYDDEFSHIVEKDDAGAVVKSTGDGALVVFSEPSTAVERCLLVQEQLGSHPKFKLRIGIDMGQVSVKSASGIVKDVFGRHVNRAARIEALTEPGHILTSFHIYDCAVGWLRGPNISWQNHGRAFLKGFEDAVSIHEAYNPRLCSPQSSDSLSSYRFSPGPMFSKRTVSDGKGGDEIREVSRTSYRPAKVDSQGWDDIVKNLAQYPPLITQVSTACSKDPFQHYRGTIRDQVKRLKKFLPVAPSILWVDDFPDNNIQERRTFEGAGCVVDLAISTEEAQERIEKSRYFLIITDMKRGSDRTAGLDFLNWLKGHANPTPAFLYASNWAVANYSEQAQDAGSAFSTAGAISLLDGVKQVFSHYYEMIPRRPVKESTVNRLIGKLFRRF